MYSTVYNVLYSKVNSIVLSMVHEFIPTNKKTTGRDVFLRKNFSSEATLYNTVYSIVYSTVYISVYST